MPPSPKRILCVDDDDDTCMMLEVFLRQAGYEAIFAQQPDDALNLANTQKFDLFLLDLWLRTGEGFDLCQKIRQSFAATPIVIYSADARQTTQEKLAEINVQAFLVKPKGLDDLLSTIEELTA